MTLDSLSKEVEIDRDGRRWRMKSTHQQNLSIKSQGVDCTRCGRSHDEDICPAKNAECNFCGNIGHNEKCCKERKEADVKRAMTLHSVQVNSMHVGGKRPTATLMTKIGETEKEIVWLCDTEVEVCLMGLNRKLLA